MQHKLKRYLKKLTNTLTLEVIDNGKGIDEADKNNTFSLGITGMRERALMINADFFVKKQKEGGTKVKVSVNLNS
jgi:signal transduction histidine kinase